MKKFAQVLFYSGIIIFLLGFGIFALTFYPIISEEVSYLISSKNARVEEAGKPSTNVLIPVDKDFGIVIPKIRANAKIIPQVDPYNSKEYQWALTKGVAMTKGSNLPGEIGNMFLFSHSSVNFYEALKYNSVFYLLSKLETNDKIDIFYKKEKIEYLVTGKKLVEPTDISYLYPKETDSTLTLMTCWPPGTSFKRLLIFAKLSN